jgi:hypothetical protein
MKVISNLETQKENQSHAWWRQGHEQDNLTFTEQGIGKRVGI